MNTSVWIFSTPATCNQQYRTVFCGYSFSSGGQTKAKSAVEEARVRHSAMLTEMQVEDESAMGLPEWTHPPPQSRPTSGTEKADRVSEDTQISHVTSTPLCS